MPTFLETICINNGMIQNIEYHQQRLDRTLSDHEIKETIDLARHIRLPKGYDKKIKCRVVYCDDVLYVDYTAYRNPTIESLRVVHSDDVSYDYKYADRKHLQSLYKHRDIYDDILIVRDGKITDSYFANVVCVKDGVYYTPNTPLLKGTKRTKLLDQGTIIECEIRKEDIVTYDYITLINAMLDLDEIRVDIRNVDL